MSKCRWMTRLLRDEHGQDLIEYALLLGFISLAIVAAISAMSANLSSLYGNANSAVESAAAS